MASRFWVGGTGTWDASDTTHWAATTGAAGGASVPTSADTVTIDASSGAGTITVNHASLNVSSLTCGAMGMTLDFATNDNNMTISGTNGNFDLSGSGTRTINMGDGTFTLSGANSGWIATTVTGLTFNRNGSTIVLSGSGQTATRFFAGGGLTYNTVTISANNGFLLSFTGNSTFTTLNIDDKNCIQIPAAGTQTVTTLNITGAMATPVLFHSSGSATAALAVTTANITGCALLRIAATGSPTATDSYDLGSNTGITITPPVTGSGGSKFIG